MNLSIFTFQSPAGPRQLLHRDSESGWGELGAWPLWHTLVPPQPPLTWPSPAQPAPRAHASNTKSSAHKSPATRWRCSPGAVSDCCCLWRLILLGVSLGVPGANRGSPGRAQWQGPPARHPGGPRCWDSDGGSKPLLPTRPWTLGGLTRTWPGSRPPWPVWPRVALAPKTRA